MKRIVLCLLSAVSFTLCGAVVESVTPNGFASPFQIWKDLPNRFEFRIDTPAKAVKLKISPRKFSIVKGKKYYVEPTIDRPFEVTAAKNGELLLDKDSRGQKIPDADDKIRFLGNSAGKRQTLAGNGG